MRIVITGASGLIGTALSAHLRSSGHEVDALQRPGGWDPDRGFVDATQLKGADAVVHLAGVGIADQRWTPVQKTAIRTSRTVGTSLIARTLTEMDEGPRVLVSGSAIGWYGLHCGDTVLEESAPAGDDFLASVVADWEVSTQAAVDAGIRVVTARTGVVQSTEGGALAKQLPFFKLGAGGRSGPGTQWVSWIDIEDEVRALEFLVTHDVSGPVNLTAPNPVTNAEYVRTLGHVVHRPTTIIPMIGPRVLYGRELADSLLLGSQRVSSAKLTAAGFEFTYPTLDDSLHHLLS